MKNRRKGKTASRAALACGIALALCAAAAAHAVPAASPRAGMPLRLDAQPGWLDDGAADDEGLAGVAAEVADADSARAAPAADRTAIAAAARRALAGRGVAGAKALARDAADADVRVHAAAQGAYVVQFAQRIGGVEVFGARASVLLDRALAVRAITGGVAPVQAAKAAPGDAFRRDPANALRSAAGAVDGLLAAAALHEVAADKAPYRYFAFDRSPTFVPMRPARIKPVWYPSAQGLLPAYYAEISGRQPGAERPLARAVVVSADDGRVLSSTDLVRDHRPFAYRVFATPQGQPYNDPYGFTAPHPSGLPDGWRPTVPAPMNLVSLVNAGLSTGDPWLADDATETVGNNVDAYFDADQVDADGYCTRAGTGSGYAAAEGDLRAPLTGPRTFDHPYDADDTLHDFLQCPAPDYAALPIPTTSAQLNAKTVQLFYAGNWLHDYFYDLGFDEQAGNLQQDNYGRGGVGGDPLLMLSGGAHPYTMLADEGESELISMGISRYSLSRRDAAAFDFAVLAHEWTHAVQARTSVQLIYNAQGGAIGEGSGDFIGQMLVLRGQDRHAYPGRPPFSGVYPATGAYSNLDYEINIDALPPAGSPGYPDNAYYHGVRRFPFSPDMAVNPLTFRNISIEHPLPPSPPAYDWLGRSLLNPEVHTAGEVWSAAMWECARNILVARPAARFEATRKRFLTDVVAGFKLFPTQPTFTEARDAVLMAIRADDEADYRRCRAGFAKRGMGAGAVSPDRYSVDFVGTVESFADRERALSILEVKLVEASGGDGDGVLDRGEAGRLDVTVLNSGFSPLDRVRVRAEAAGSDFEFPSGRQSGEVALAAGASTTLSIDVDVRSMQGAAELPLAIVARDQRHPTAHAREDGTFRVNYDLVRDRYVDDVSTDVAFPADWASGDIDTSDYCYVYCNLQWRRTQHLGKPAYVIRDDTHVAFDASLASHEFLVSAADPLRLTLYHDYLFDRAPGDPMRDPTDSSSAGLVLIAVDGGDWEAVDDYLVSGPAAFLGRSNGWRSDTLDFGTAFAGHRVKFLVEGMAWRTWATSTGYWAIARIEIEGAAEPMFSRIVADVN